RRHGADAAAKGRLPWRVGEVYRELVAAFRDRDPARILERAAILGHYVGDAHVPLHAALNYDGQLTGQTGIHNRWDTGPGERATLRSRLAASASTLGSLWLTAWQEAGRPPLDAAFRFPYVRGQTRAVLATLDGAGAELIADAVARGVMPRLGRLRATGATAK